MNDGGWWRCVAELGEWRGGATPPKAVASYWGGRIPWVSPKDMTGSVIQGSEDLLTDAGAARLTVHQPGDIAVVFRSGILRQSFPVARGAVPFTVNQDLKVLHAAADVEAPYAFHLLRGLERQVVDSAVKAGTTVESVDPAVFYRMPVRVPGRREQRWIAQILETLDKAVLGADRLVAKLRRVRAGLATDLLTSGVGADGQVRRSASRPTDFKDTRLGRVPRDWDVAPLRDYGSRDRPYLKTGPFGSNLNQAHWVDKGVPVITIGSLGEGKFIESDLLHVSEQTARTLRSYAVVPGDVVFSRVADVGRSVLVRSAQNGWIMSSNLMWLSVDRRRVVPAWLQATLNGNPHVRSQIRALVNSAGRDVANGTVINALQFPWPPLPEQERIVAALLAADERIFAEERAAEKMHRLREGIRQGLLSGQLQPVAAEQIAA